MKSRASKHKSGDGGILNLKHPRDVINNLNHVYTNFPSSFCCFLRYGEKDSLGLFDWGVHSNGHVIERT